MSASIDTETERQRDSETERQLTHPMLGQECAVAGHSVGVAVLYPLSGWDANSVVSCPHNIDQFLLQPTPGKLYVFLPVYTGTFHSKFQGGVLLRYQSSRTHQSQPTPRTLSGTSRRLAHSILLAYRGSASPEGHAARPPGQAGAARARSCACRGPLLSHCSQ
jgi:hypothetical protein|eukprot:COSAG03_NODE_2053_length_3176_cov_3.488788_3_plen_163_part_00